MIWLAVAFNLRTFLQQYRAYNRMVYLNARRMYIKKRRGKNSQKRSEAVTRAYLQEYHLSFFQWLKKVRSYGIQG